MVFEHVSPKQYLQKEMGRVQESVAVLFDGLREALSSTKYFFPQPSDSGLEISAININPTRIAQTCFVSIDDSIQRFSRHGDHWKQEADLPLPRYQYSTIHYVIVDSVPYLAAGHCHGIELINLSHPEEKKSVVAERVGTLGNTRFRGVGIMDEKVERSASLFHSTTGLMLIASHSNAGILRIPLDVLVSTDNLVVTSQDSEYFILQKEPADQRHCRVKVAAGQAYVALEGEIFKYQQRHLERLFSLPPGEHVTALEINTLTTNVASDQKTSCTVNSLLNVFIGTNQGRIYGGTDGDIKLFLDLHQHKSKIAQLQAGTYLQNQEAPQREGIFFITDTEGIRSPLLFTDGKIMPQVSSSSWDEEVLDFYFTGQSQFWIVKQKKGGTLIIREQGKKEYRLPLTYRKPRGLCLGGG